MANILDKEFEHFIELACSKGVTDAQKIDLRRTFMAGAKTFQYLLRTAAAESPICALAMMKQLELELIQFKKDFDEGKA